jgi:hypothetical protein
VDVTTQQPAMPTGEPSIYAAVADILWSEREMLEMLLFKLVEEQFVLTSGAARWLSRADAEVRSAMDGLRASEVLRAAEVDSLVRALSLRPETTLGELALAVPEPWSALYADHRAALRSLVAEVESVTAENRRLLDAGSQAIRQTLDSLDDCVIGFADDAVLGGTA